MHLSFGIVFILFEDKSSFENCFACIFGISYIGSCFLPFLSLNFSKGKKNVNGILWDKKMLFIIFFFVINNFKNMHLSIISAISRISRFRYTFVALVDDKEDLPAKIAEYIIIPKIVLNWNWEKRRHVLMRMRFSKSIIRLIWKWISLSIKNL